MVSEKSDVEEQANRLRKDKQALCTQLAQLKKRCEEFEKNAAELKQENEERSRKNKDLSEQARRLTRVPESAADLKPGDTQRAPLHPAKESLGAKPKETMPAVSPA